MEPDTGRYLGRLCHFSKCPKDKLACYVEGCGAVPLLQQDEDFAFDWSSASQGSVVLYDRGGAG